MRGTAARPFVLALAILLPGLAASPALADFEVAAGGGVFGPYEGDTGYAVFGQMMGSNEARSWRFGGEFKYREFQTEFFRVDDVDVQMFQIQGLVHYRFIPDAVFTPYIGGGVGFAVNVIDTDEIEDERPNIDVFSRVGGGVGAFALLGLELSLGEHVMLFAEGRATGDVQFTRTDGDLDAENLGGGEGLAGVRVRF